VAFNFVNDVLAIRLRLGRQQGVPSGGRTVAEVDGEALSALASTRPGQAHELAPAVRFADD
jgi:hypothetical protein